MSALAGPIIANNTPLVALALLNHLDLLRDLYGEVLIPLAVRAEFLDFAPSARLQVLAAAHWIKPMAVTSTTLVRGLTGLDRGEAEVLALAQEQQARLVIVDERKARRMARRMGFAITGTLGVLLLAKEQGLITALRPLLDALQASGFFLDESLVWTTLAVAGEA